MNHCVNTTDNRLVVSSLPQATRGTYRFPENLQSLYNTAENIARRLEAAPFFESTASAETRERHAPVLPDYAKSQARRVLAQALQRRLEQLNLQCVFSEEQVLDALSAVRLPANFATTACTAETRLAFLTLAVQAQLQPELALDTTTLCNLPV